MSDRLATTIGGLRLRNPVICASGEPVMTEAGIRAALAAGVAGVIAKSVNERPDAARQLDMNQGAVKVAVHRLRRRLRDAIKNEISHTVKDRADIDREMRDLLEALL